MSTQHKILIIDDEQDILDLLQRFMARKNLFEVEVCTNPVQAVEKIKHNNYSLVLTDIMIPEMNGVEVLKAIKASNPSIHVVMMTAFSTLDRILECEKLGAKDYVTKPFISLKDVESKILDILGL